ncbi:MAG: diaminopimelate decarboxylase [Clostridiales Family XIII bacterium]|jgi:diaminopimelate decarboxylase|nr:diaminopimelate decarboxylase [Clostridiales Family XIII bacterium]
MTKPPFVSHEKLLEIVRSHPTPFHLYDEAGIRATARAVNRAFGWNAGYREYFAVKANPNPVLLSMLKEEGCGVDCSSLTELMLAEAAGFRGGEIMFSSNMTPAGEFVYARGLGATINLDDFTHIDFLEACAGIPETVCCRYNPGAFHIGNSIMDGPAESKFGFTRRQLAEGFARLRGKGARAFGLHAFLASNALSEGYYPALARLLFEAAVELRDETGIAVSFINLSGGIGIPYRPGEEACDIELIGESVREAFHDTLAPAGMQDIALCSELGRFMLGPHGCLVASAVHRKDTYRHYIGLDACAADLLRPAMYGAYHHMTVSGKEGLPADHVYDVVGSLCENNDKFAAGRALPEIEPGDLIVIHDTGAHGHSMGYNYNGRLRAAELLLREDGSVARIRRAERPQDYFATLSETECYPRLLALAQRR